MSVENMNLNLKTFSVWPEITALRNVSRHERPLVHDTIISGIGYVEKKYTSSSDAFIT